MWLDFETRSLCNLKLWGGRIYAAHHSTEIICVSCKEIVDGPILRWQHVDKSRPDFSPKGMIPNVARQALRRAKSVTAHNADGFDSHVFRRLYNVHSENPDVVWRDSIHLARLGGFPAGLEELGQAVLSKGKDPYGKELIKTFSIPHMKGGKLKLRAILGGALDDMMHYCDMDVNLLAEIDHEWLELIERKLPDWERRNLGYSRLQNERGIKLDVELAQDIIAANSQFIERLRKDIPVITNGELQEDDLTKPKVLLSYFQRHGLTPIDPISKKPSIGKKALEKILDMENEEGDDDGSGGNDTGPERGDSDSLGSEVSNRQQTSSTPASSDASGAPYLDLPSQIGEYWLDDDSGDTDGELGQREPISVSPIVFDVCRARLGVSRITTGKLQTGIGSADSEGIIRDGIVYAGSHTFRYAGRRFQLLNLARGEVDAQAIDEAREILERLRQSA